jgi:hypothetical protein
MEYENQALEKKECAEPTETERKTPIQKVDKIVIPAEQAKEEWHKYVDLLKTRTDKHLKIMKEAMYYAKNGKELIDIYEVMKKAGLSSTCEPRLAIARADLHEIYFEKRDEGAGTFGKQARYSETQVEWERTMIELPSRTFEIHWSRPLAADGRERWEIANKIIKTKVPIIPAELMPEGDLENYYVLWEVKEWQQLPQTKDPFLLKRISENLFVILGTWELTELERAVIDGLHD